jgi:hypothetical protein
VSECLAQYSHLTAQHCRQQQAALQQYEAWTADVEAIMRPLTLETERETERDTEIETEIDTESDSITLATPETACGGSGSISNSGSGSSSSSTASGGSGSKIGANSNSSSSSSSTSSSSWGAYATASSTGTPEPLKAEVHTFPQDCCTNVLQQWCDHHTTLAPLLNTVLLHWKVAAIELKSK